MDRSRSYSRHRPIDSNQPRSPSPVASRDSTSSTSSRGRPLSRPPPYHRGSFSRSSSRSSSRSQTRSPSRRQHYNHLHEHHQHHSHNHEGHHEHRHGLIKTSAGIIAGLGLATVLAHKVWTKDEEDHDNRSNSGSKSKHHRHHHHHQVSERHSEHHHRRASDASSNAERIVDRARGTHGRDVLYVEEAGPFRRSDARRMSLDPRPFERIERQSGGRPLRPLPYPETPYPNEKFYEPRGLRASFSEPVPVSR